MAVEDVDYIVADRRIWLTADRQKIGKGKAAVFPYARPGARIPIAKAVALGLVKKPKKLKPEKPKARRVAVDVSKLPAALQQQALR